MGHFLGNCDRQEIWTFLFFAGITICKCKWTVSCYHNFITNGSIVKLTDTKFVLIYMALIQDEIIFSYVGKTVGKLYILI